MLAFQSNGACAAATAAAEVGVVCCDSGVIVGVDERRSRRLGRVGLACEGWRGLPPFGTAGRVECEGCRIREPACAWTSCGRKIERKQVSRCAPV